MTKSSALRDLIIGFVFLGAIVAMGVITLAVTNVPFLGGTPVDVVVPFDNVDGLRDGDGVRLAGYQVGQVQSIGAQFDNGTLRPQVTIRFSKSIRLPPDTRFEVRAASALGGSYVEIVPGDGEPAQLESGDFRGTARADAFEQIGMLVEEVRFGNGLIEELLKNETIAQDFAQIVREAREVVSSVNNAEGILGALIKREDLRDRFETIVENIDATVEGVNEGRGILGMLVNDSEARDDLRRILDNAEDISLAIRESRGTLGKLVNDPTLHDDLQTAVKDLRSILGDVEEGKGALGLLLGDEETRDRLDNIVIDLEATLDAIAEGEGTIGQLTMNRELYDRLNRVLINTENAVEDFREQAPISTFVNALFAAF